MPCFLQGKAHVYPQLVHSDAVPWLCAAGAQAESRQHSIGAKSIILHIKEKYYKFCGPAMLLSRTATAMLGRAPSLCMRRANCRPQRYLVAVFYFWGHAYSCTGQQINPAACKGCHRHAQARCRRLMKNGMWSASAEGWQRQSWMIRIRCPWVRVLACFKGEVALPSCAQQAFHSTVVIHSQCGHIAPSSEKRASQSLVQVRVLKAVWVAALGVCMVGGTASLTLLRVLIVSELCDRCVQYVLLMHHSLPRS